MTDNKTGDTHLANPGDAPTPDDEIIGKWKDTHIRDVPLDPPVYTMEAEVQKIEAVPETGSGYDEQIKQATDRAAKVLRHSRKLIERAVQVKQANMEDPLQRDIDVRVNTTRYYDKQANKINENTAKAKKQITEIATNLDNSINSLPPKSETEIEYGQQYRDHIKSLPENDRWNFVSEKMESEDWDVVHSVLRAAPFLSGLDEAGVDQLRDLYKKQRYPEMISARDHLQEVLGYLWETQRTVIMKAAGLRNKDVETAIRKNSDAISLMGEDGIAAKIYS